MDNTMNPGGGKARNPDLNAHATPARTHSDAHGNPSIGGLLASLWRDTTDLIAQQAELAKAEASEKITRLGRGVGAMAASGAVMLAGFIILLLSAVNALAPYLEPELAPWLAPLLVGGLVVIVGYAMFVAGRKAIDAQYLKPTRTIESMRSNTEMVKEHVR